MNNYKSVGSVYILLSGVASIGMLIIVNQSFWPLVLLSLLYLHFRDENFNQKFGANTSFMFLIATAVSMQNVLIIPVLIAFVFSSLARLVYHYLSSLS